MADDAPMYYKIVARVPFEVPNVGQFLPSKRHEYWITPEIYNLTLEDGNKVSDLCASATPTNRAP